AGRPHPRGDRHRPPGLPDAARPRRRGHARGRLVLGVRRRRHRCRDRHAGVAVMRSARLVWFGLLGAPLAWAVFHVAGFAVTQSSCEGGNAGFSAWTAALTARAPVVAVGSISASIVVWRRTRDVGEEPPA